MNTAYDLTESAVLIAKLVALTREGKIEWFQHSLSLIQFGSDVTTRYQTPLDGELNALIWLSSKSAGFRLFEMTGEAAESRMARSERDLLAISLDHEDGSSRGEIYINLMSLLELARRSADKIEPKVDRIKQYLDKLAV